MKTPLFALLTVALATMPSNAAAQVKVTVQTEKSEVGEGVTFPVDPMPRVRYGMQAAIMMPGLEGINGERLTISPQGGHQIPLMVDGRVEMFGQGNGVVPKGQKSRWISQNVPLKSKPGSRARHGVTSEWVTSSNIHITQIVEIIPSKTPPKGVAGGKRQLDVMLVRYIIENKDTMKHTVGLRNTIDIYLINNDGALFASPTTHKGQIINGHEFKGDKVPEYLQVLQQPNLQNPGYVTHFTLKVGKLEGPTRFVCTTLGGVGGQWDVQVMPAGDSAVAIFFDPKEIPPGGKRDMAYAYGIGIASNPENEGRVNIDLSGGFEPGKQFTITAYVEDPINGQSLSLDLPAGLQRIDGKTKQAVPEASERGQSIVIWKVKVDKLGSYPIKVRSSNGVTYNTQLTIEAAAKGEVIRVGSKMLHVDADQPEAAGQSEESVVGHPSLDCGTGQIMPAEFWERVVSEHEGKLEARRVMLREMSALVGLDHPRTKQLAAEVLDLLKMVSILKREVVNNDESRIRRENEIRIRSADPQPPIDAGKIAELFNKSMKRHDVQSNGTSPAK